MSAERLYSEIFDEFEATTSKQEKIAILRKYDHPKFRNFLAMAFNPNCVFDVELPAYRPAPEPAGLNFTYLDMEMSKMYRFIKDHPKRTTDISAEKKKELLTVILESLHADEATLLCGLIKKDLDIKFLTAKLVKEAYPDINLED